MHRRSLLLAIAAIGGTSFRASAASPSPSLEPVVAGLDFPWGLAFLPDGTALVTERPGRLSRIDIGAEVKGPSISGLPEIEVDGQGGLLGLAIDPDFSTNRLVYLAFTEPRQGGNSTSVFRARLSPDSSQLVEGKVIFRQNTVVPGGHHFGSRLVFDKSGSLFITTGDRNVRDHAQDPATHLGKLLRVTRDGTAAPDNPLLPGWAPEVWSIGHRNMQGAALNPDTGDIWTVEHGARGGDEINIPRAGKNYGWPIISYGREYAGSKIGEGTAREGMEQPLHLWDPSIAPSGMTFCNSDVYPTWRGNLFVGALAGQAIVRLELRDGRVTSEEHFFKDVARFRDVVQGPDGYIYALSDAAEPDGTLWRLLPPS